MLYNKTVNIGEYFPPIHIFLMEEHCMETDNVQKIKLSVRRIKYLVRNLNTYRRAYYNTANSLISDYEYDMLFDELKQLETETGFIMSNSPTQTVGYTVNSKFNKVVHTKPLLSLDKTQDMDEFIKFCLPSQVLLMHKLDGLTIKLHYNEGKLVQASTRGNGLEGDDITTNAKYFTNIPLTIPTDKDIMLEGEAIITRDDFERINAELPDDKKFKNARNLASGSVKQLDTKVVMSRHIKFVCWNANDLSTDGTMESGLKCAETMGFDIVDYYVPLQITIVESVPSCVEKLQKDAKNKFLPIDGIVAIYNDITYGESLGKTSHHFNNGFAFKFYDEEEETVLTGIEWSMGKTGDLTPVAIFEPVEIDGTTVTRASLHNISCLQALKLGMGDRILVYKANQIIPQVRKSLTTGNNIEIPSMCPVCGGVTKVIETEDGVKVLTCTNDNCRGKLLGKLNHFVSKNAMNIDGLSEATLDKLISLKILNNLTDIYNIQSYTGLLYTLEGFGETSINKLINSIENSKNTTLDKLLNAVSIPTVGKSIAKLLANFIDNDETRVFELGTTNLTRIEGIGDIMEMEIHNWFNNPDNVEMLKTLLSLCTFKKPEKISSTKFHGIGFVITGKLTKYTNRAALESVILHNGGILQSSVSTNTNYLINNDINSKSSKNNKAKELGIPIISEQDFINMLGDDTTVTHDITESAKSITPTQNKPVRKKLF